MDMEAGNILSIIFVVVGSLVWLVIIVGVIGWICSHLPIPDLRRFDSIRLTKERIELKKDARRAAREMLRAVDEYAKYGK